VAAPVKVLWTQSAVGHLQSAFEYLNAENPRAAAESVERILSAVERVKQFPNMGRPGRVEDTRELVVTGTPFLVAYRLKAEHIQILAVLHAARKWPAGF
jgi:toxin ParE1/3/4